MRVLLLDEGFISGTATALGLHAVGCRVDVIATVGGHACVSATGGQWRFAPRVSDASLPTIIEHSRAAGRYDVIYPTTEPLQRLLWPHARHWPELRLPTDDNALPSHFADKRMMSALARTAGVDIPDAVYRVSPSTIDETIRQLGLPIVIKGVVGRGGQTTFIASSSAGVRDALRKIAARGTQAFAQRYINGPTFLVGGVFHRGTPLGLYAGEKRIQFPARTGPAAVLLSCSDTALLRSATRIFEAARLTGLASADFIRAPDGRFHFLELNPRPWGSIGAASHSNVDLFGPLFELWSGGSPSQHLSFAAGVRSPILPLAFASPAAWASGDATRALLRAPRAIATGRITPALLLHLMHRAIRVAKNW